MQFRGERSIQVFRNAGQTNELIKSRPARDEGGEWWTQRGSFFDPSVLEPRAIFGATDGPWIYTACQKFGIACMFDENTLEIV